MIKGLAQLCTFSKLRHRELGLAFIELAVAVPILISLALGIGYLYNYLRVYQIVSSAAESGAAVASGAEVISLSDPTVNFLNWTHSLGGDLPYWPLSTLDTEFCRTGSGSQKDCILEAKTAKRISAQSRVGQTAKKFLGITTAYSLPFDLVEEGTTPGYYPTQILPLIGIERACVEPFNETGSSLAASPARYHDLSLTPDDCNHVKPMYWQSPVMADFDGDRKEDLVFFRPNGTSTTWGTKTGAADADFIIYYSGGAFSLTAGRGYFNLSTAKSAGVPADIPIVADYDRDGISDYGVFDPETGDYRIAFSSVNFAVIGTGNMNISDPDGELGLIAIPGSFSGKANMQVAVIQTGAASAADRFDTYMTSAISVSYEDLADELDSGTITLPDGADLEATVGSANIYKYKPQAGKVSVPAFADYDDDGITEIGYLSWFGGNLTRQIGGKVAGVRSGTSVLTSSQLFPAADSPVGNPLSVRMNPFAIAVDAQNNLLYTDAVDHRLWKISPDANKSTDYSGSSVSVVANSHALTAARSSLATFNAQDDFPRENVWNLPETDTRSIVDNGVESSVLPAADRSLKYPRKIAVATEFDGAAYVADWGHGRIIRIESGDTGIDLTSKTTVILGSYACTAAPGTCGTLEGYISGWVATPEVWPMALSIVPDTTNPDRYFLAFSSEYAVYLLTHTNPTGGPSGANMSLIHLAGARTTPPWVALPPPLTPSEQPNYKLIKLGLTPVNGTSLCPVVDIEYNDGDLLLASSCSVQVKPTAMGGTSNLDYPVGGILRLKSGKAVVNFQPASSNSLFLYVGAFLAYPCSLASPNTYCSRPVSGKGVYKRSIDIQSSTISLDIVNPTDMEFDDYGALYFVHQWNSSPYTSDGTGAFPNAPNRTDHMHFQDLYRVELDPTLNIPTRIEPVSNNLLYGQGTIPVESADWNSPYNSTWNAAPVRRILAHEAPIKTAPFPFRSGIVINGDYLYSATPYLANPTAYPADFPYYTKPANIGFIYRTFLDQDGDGTGDSTDTDKDGDAASDATEAAVSGFRSLYCPEIWKPDSLGPCRPQDKLGLPQVYFTRLSGTLAFNSEANAPTKANFGEYILLNSVSECGNAAQCSPDGSSYNGVQARPETWATLLGYGNDQDLDSADACNETSTADITSPYYRCSITSNGPIAAPQALHALVGAPSAQQGYAFSSYPGGGFLASTTPGTTRLPDSNLTLFPVILSSTRPRENGIKPVRRVPLASSKSPGVEKSGLICRDYITEGFQQDSVAAATAKPFRFEMNTYAFYFQKWYFFSGFENDWDSTGDNDNLNYMADCSYSSADGYNMFDSRIAATEGIVLQLDHDNTVSKLTSHGNADHWPDHWVTGTPSPGENKRLFFFADFDGDGVRNPAFIFPWKLGLSLATDPLMNQPTTLVAMGLKNSTSKYDAGVINYMDVARSPLTNLDDFADFAWSDKEEPRPPYLRLDKSSAPDYQNAFDAGWRDNGRDNTLFTTLDFEPFIASKLNITGRQDIGAGMFANYTQSNRFRNIDSGDIEPPGIVAARNALRLGLNIAPENFVESEAELSKGKAYVTFVRRDAGNWITCETYADGESVETCNGIKVAYRTEFFNTPITVSYIQPLNEAALSNYREACDPNAPDGFACPGDAPAPTPAP